MKKAIQFIACFTFLGLILSAFMGNDAAPVVGYKAPTLVVGDSVDDTVSLADYKGEYVLVTFWSSSDAASRLRCNEYTALAAEIRSFNHIAVNFDSDEDLYNEVVRLDNLTVSSQYHAKGVLAQRIKKNYNLERGLHSFLINKQGMITAIDPDSEIVKSML